MLYQKAERLLLKLLVALLKGRKGLVKVQTLKIEVVVAQSDFSKRVCAAWTIIKLEF
jgi:hypothetical protein